jgi:SAM-dependent methyltransferase
MLRRARRRKPRTPLVCLDAAALPIRSKSLDAVTFHSVLYLLPDQAATLRETARVLRSGGRAVLLEPQAGRRATLFGLARALPSPRWAIIAACWRAMSGLYGRPTAHSLWNALESAGLRVLRIDETLGGLGLLAVAEKP